MMNPTNLVVTNGWTTAGGTIVASPVTLCDQCGGLFVSNGQLYYGPPHVHTA